MLLTHDFCGNRRRQDLRPLTVATAVAVVLASGCGSDVSGADQSRTADAVSTGGRASTSTTVQTISIGYVVREQVVDMLPGWFSDFGATGCGPGLRVLGGGIDNVNGDARLLVVSSAPYVTTNPADLGGWTWGVARATADWTGTFIVRIICADVGP